MVLFALFVCTMVLAEEQAPTPAQTQAVAVATTSNAVELSKTEIQQAETLGKKHHKRHHKRHHLRRHHRRHHKKHMRRHHKRRHHSRKYRHHHRRQHFRRHHVKKYHHVRRHHNKRLHQARKYQKIHHTVRNHPRKHHHVKRHHHVRRIHHTRHQVRRVHHKVRRVQKKYKMMKQQMQKMNERLRIVASGRKSGKARKFEIIRKEISLPKLQKIQLHQKTETVVESLKSHNIPKNARALIVSVYYNHGNHPAGHGYLNFNIYQKNADKSTKSASMKNYHYNWYFNSDYYEFMLPWSGKLPQDLVVDITATYNTGTYPSHGNQNWYDINVKGYILH